MLSAVGRSLRILSSVITADTGVMAQQTRNTFILRRRNPIPLHKKNARPPKLRNRYFIYDLVEDTSIVRKPDVKIILKEFVDGVGQKGDVLTMRPMKAYNEFLVPGLAVYATPFNIERYNAVETVTEKFSEHSSIFAQRTVNCLSRLVLEITMNKSEPWELEKWHVRTSFRKANFIVPEHAIEMPPGKICGPDLSLQDKEFYVTVTVNGKEKVNVRCRIHHWATGLERLPYVYEHWKIPREPLFPEQAEVLQNMPFAQ